VKRIYATGLICLLLSISGNSQFLPANGSISNLSLYNPPNSPGRSVPVSGNPLLFDFTWAHAKLTTENNKVIQNDSLFFNFNKLSQNLLVTQDFEKIYEIDKREVKSVTFYWHDSVYIFEHVFAINTRDFFQEFIQNDQKYSLYKHFHTSIKPVSWHTNGLAWEGSVYDAYVDEPVYYIIFPNKETRILDDTRPKSIRRVFRLQRDSKTVDDFLTKNKDRFAGENLLWNLIIFLNN
jgi:hypothetical protein